MDRRRFLSTLSGLLFLPLAGCSSDSTSVETTTSTPMSTPTPTPTPSPQLTSVNASEVMVPRKLNPLAVTIYYAHLVTDKSYSIEFVTESDAGTKSITHPIKRHFGIYLGLTGFRADAPEGTSTEGAILSYTAMLKEGGVEVDSSEGVVVSYE